MFSKTIAIIVLLLSFVSAGAAQANATDDYNLCAAMPDHQASFACIEQLAQSGNATAQLALGGFYAGGYGVPQDPQQAAVWYQKSAEQGNATAKIGRAS